MSPVPQNPSARGPLGWPALLGVASLALTLRLGVLRDLADTTLASVLVGDARGMVAVVDGTTLQLRYHLKGGAPVVGPVTVTHDGWLIAAFEDRTIRCYEMTR